MSVCAASRQRKVFQLLRSVSAIAYMTRISPNGETVLPLAPAASLVSADARGIDKLLKSGMAHSFPNNRQALTAISAPSVSKWGCLRVH